MEEVDNSEIVSIGGDHEKSRLIIYKIELENFKSYGGKKTIGPFHKSFNAIVGPNGSGKSNVIDAMLFVFGKRAKHMRSNKVSELIHNSKINSNNDKASVSVHFKEIIDISEDEYSYKIVPGSEIVIKREVFKNSEQTKYYINEKLSSYSEITKLLSEKGTDLEHNRFLILQGEVELIAQMKPKSTNPNEDGLIEYIEDIIGSSKYIQDIEKHSLELEQFNELRQEKLNRFKLSEKELNNLKSPYNTAIEFFGIERELYIAKLLSHMEEQKDFIRKIGKLKEELIELFNSKEKIKNRKKSLENDKTELEKESKDNNSKVKTLEAQIEKEENELKKIILNDEELRAVLKNLKKRLTKQEQCFDSEKKLIPELEERIANLKEEIIKKERKIATITKNLEVAQEKLDSLQKTFKNSVEETRKKKDQAEKELSPIRKNLLKLQQSHDLLIVELELLKQKQIRRQENEESNKKQLENMKRRIEVLKKENNEISKNIKEKKLIIDEKNNIYEKLLKDLNNINSLINIKKIEIEDARNIQASNSNNLRTVPESKIKNNKLTISEMIMKYFHSKKKSGIYGRLGDLGDIDKKYDIALTSSVSQLENIVVQTTEDAQEVIEYVRNSNLGRISCIILDKLASSLKESMEKIVNVPDNSERLFNLINFKDQKFRIAWYFAVRDTLVVENLDIATKISYNNKRRWRVVTLSGELIDTSGTMTGGGVESIKSKHGMKRNDGKIKVPNVEDICKMETEFENLQKKHNQIKKELKEVEECIQLLNNDVNDLNLSLEKVAIELSSIETHESQNNGLNDDFESPDKEQTINSKKITELECEINELKSKISKCEESMKSKQEIVDKLTKAMNDIGGPEMKRQVEIVNELTKELNSLEVEINKEQVEIGLSEKKKSKAIESLEGFESKCSSIKESIQKTESQLLELEEVALKIMEKKKNLEIELADFMNEYNSFQNKFEQIEKNLEKIELNDVEVSSNIDSINNKISEIEHNNIKQNQKKIQKLRNEATFIPLIPIIEDEKTEEDSENKKKIEAIKTKFLVEDVEDSEYEILIQKINVSKIKSLIDSLEVQLNSLCEQHSTDRSTKHFRPSPEILSQYSSQLEQYKKRNQEVEEATNARDECRKQLDLIKQKRYNEFINGFKIISSQLKEIYQMITLGGDAELELIDNVDPFSDGIIFSVRPPKKSWRPIHNLSGGEKTLSSLALVFALHQYKPSPLYFMDEVDAALDFRNVSIIATFIKEKTKNAQFIVVSLRNHMFELADKLVGIYKTFDITKSISIYPSDYSREKNNDENELVNI